MRFNYGLEKKKFEENWEEIRKEYREAGMDEESIRAMYEYDWEDFKRERNWCLHNQNLEGVYQTYENEIRDVSESVHPLMKKFEEELTTRLDESDFSDPYGWIEAFADEKLYEATMCLNDEQKLILTLLFQNGWSQKEVAELFGIAPKNVFKRLSVIKKIIKNSYEG